MLRLLGNSFFVKLVKEEQPSRALCLLSLQTWNLAWILHVSVSYCFSALPRAYLLGIFSLEIWKVSFRWIRCPPEVFCAFVDSG